MKLMYTNVYLFFLFVITTSCVSGKAESFIIDHDVLLENHNKIKDGNKYLLNAKNELIQNADAILADAILYSVTLKKEHPGNSSINDFYSLAPYWWPDNSKIDGLPYINKDGQVNPETKEIKDSFMVRNVSLDIYTLGLAYFYTKDEKYVKWINKLIEVFFIKSNTKMNPNFDFAQVIKGRKQRGSVTINGASFIKLIEGVELVKKSELLDFENIDKLKNWFRQLAFWLENNRIAKLEGESNNNISVYYTAQLVTYYMFINENTKARNILKTKGKHIIENQIDKDGSLKSELTRATPWEYIKYTLSAFNYLVQLSSKLDIDLYYYENQQKGSICKMYKWLIPYAQNNKQWEFSDESPSYKEVNMVLLRSNILNYNKTPHESKAGLTAINILTNKIY